MRKRQSEDDSDDLTLDVISALNHRKEKNAYGFNEEDPANIPYWISTGSTLLDYAISNRRDGGIPFGRITEINGLESTGKSLLSFHIIANTQKLGGIGIIMDTEGRRLEKDFLLRMGIDPKKLVVTNPGTIEGCFEQIEKTIITVRSKYSAREKPVTIIWDSLAATPPQAEIEGTYDPQSQIGIGAKAVNRGFRKLTKTIGTESIALIIINQLRMNMKAMPFSDPYVTPYGKALAYYASIRVRIDQGKKIKDSDDEVIGILCNTRVLKNSLGPPFRNAAFPIIFGYGADDQQSWYDYLHKKKLITKSAGNSVLKIGEKEFRFAHDEWKQFLSKEENKAAVLDYLESLLVRKYDTVNPVNTYEAHIDENDTDTEIG